MTKQDKLNVVYPKIKDWVKACAKNISENPLEGDDIKWFKDAEAEAISVDASYKGEGLYRWNHSRCELHFDPREEFIPSTRCLFAKAADKDGFVLYFRIDHRKTVNGEGSLTNFD